MFLKRVVWFFFLSSVLSVSAQVDPTGGKGTAIVRVVAGTVEYQRAGNAEWMPARVNQTLQPGDRLRTRENSRATLQMADLTQQRLRELTTILIMAPTQPGQGPGVFGEIGTIYFNNRGKPGETPFRSRIVSGAIRGTEFNLEVEANGRTVLTLLDGEIELTNGLGGIVVQSGEQAVAEEGLALRKTAFLDAINIIQWTLYYPAVLDVDELFMGEIEPVALVESLQAYRSGDLLQALANYPFGGEPASDRARLYRAALLLAVGQVDKTLQSLDSLSSPSPFADSLRKVIAAVKHQDWVGAGSPSLASDFLADSYYHQSQSRLDEALQSARGAVKRAPGFGFAWVRVAELEFGFGRTDPALAALEKGLGLSPRNAQGLALRGFLLSAQNRMTEAERFFEEAIAVDGALGNAWLGRGLMKIRRGEANEGRRDLQVAATLEPNRALLRSYLGKAFSNAGDRLHARRELKLAAKLDPNDPTPWLYLALLNEQQNQLNEAVLDLERSKDLNDNRSVYRSGLLLDQDRAVRSANLARIYQDVGMIDVSAREASRAVANDYGNYSAHLFLANSYDALRDPKQVNLRFETAWLSEYLLANLLSPASAGSLSPAISQQEYSRLFQQDGVGVVSSTEYLSRGDWVQSGSQFGTFGNTSYSVDANYRSENGQRFNNDQEQLTLSAQVKQQLTQKDSIYLQAAYYDFEGGDLSQVYDPNNANRGVRLEERQEPLLLAGYHHEWAPGIHTIGLVGRLDDTFLTDDPMQQTLIGSSAGGLLILETNTVVNVNQHYRSELEIYTAELQQIWQTERQSLIVGGRYQVGEFETDSLQTMPSSLGFAFPANGVVSDQDFENDFQRISLYAYENWRVTEQLVFIAGLSYDKLYYPENFRHAPIKQAEKSRDRVSPKAGLVWTPTSRTTLRAAYTRSLGGVSLDQSFRLEPTQIAGFNQAYRSLIPESVAGAAAVPTFETWGIGLDHDLGRGAYFGVEAELLKSRVEQTLGAYDIDIFSPPPPAQFDLEERLRFEEKALAINLHQLIGETWAVGGRYRVSKAELDRHLKSTDGKLDTEVEATLHQLNLFVLFHHRCGFFARADAFWYSQDNGDQSSITPGDDFWQFNAFIGYRFPRRQAEVRVGLLNITNQDYRLNPLNLSRELPRDRTLATSLRFYF